jgi:tetratricopeptide (TPR) repeat protein
MSNAATATPPPFPQSATATTAATPGMPVSVPIELANRWLSALMQWTVVRAQLPDKPELYLAFVTALRQEGRAEQAETVLGEAARRFPFNLDLATEYANCAEQRQDWDAALQRWDAMRAAFPAQALGDLKMADLLHQRLGRPAEAEQVLEAAAARLPGELGVWLEYAETAARRKDRPAAIARYKALCERFPEHLKAWRAVVPLLRETRQFDEADMWVATALTHFPDDAALMSERAWVAQNRGDWREAVQRWEAARLQHPNLRVAYWMQAGVLLHELGELDGAETLLNESVQRFPDHLGIAMDHAALAERRGNWREAMRRLEVLATRFPGNAAITEGIGRVANQIQLHAIDHAEAAPLGEAIPPPVAVSSTADGAEMRDLLLNFESMGVNCEFGMVQRRCGAEPLGLLRWVWLQTDALTKALRQRFDGVGDADKVRLAIDETTREFYIHEEASGTVMHTFKMEAEIGAEVEKFRLQMAKRLQYLRRKFIDDLGAADKIFVYKSYVDVSFEDILQLRDALNEYGPNTLFFLKVADAGNPAGSVQWAAPNLITGYMDRFITPGGHWDELSLPMWLTVVKKAYALWRDSRTEQEIA